MKISKKSTQNQKAILERKIKPWLSIRGDRVPPSGWLKAIRGALGISTRQLAERLGVEHTAVIQFEKRETEGSVSIESIQKLAQAMRCQLVYAVVPQEPFATLDALLDDQAVHAARAIVQKVDHTMRLEQQGVSDDVLTEQTKELAKHIKDEMKPNLWNTSRSLTKQKKSK